MDSDGRRPEDEGQAPPEQPHSAPPGAPPQEEGYSLPSRRPLPPELLSTPPAAPRSAVPSLSFGPPVPGAVLVDQVLYIPAGLAPRVLAFCLDGALLSILHAIVVALINIPQPDEAEAYAVLAKAMEAIGSGAVMGGSLRHQLLGILQPALLFHALLYAICAAYFIIFHGLLGATIGKQVLGLKVLRRDGQPITAGTAALRYLVYFLTRGLAYTAWLVPATAEKRTLHDMASGTNVFKAVNTPELPEQL